MEMFEVLLLAGWLIKNAANAINNCHLETQTLSTYIYIYRCILLNNSPAAFPSSLYKEPMILYNQ